MEPSCENGTLLQACRSFVEDTGFEPVTSCMPCKRSSQLSYTPIECSAFLQPLLKRTAKIVSSLLPTKPWPNIAPTPSKSLRTGHKNGQSASRMQRMEHDRPRVFQFDAWEQHPIACLQHPSHAWVGASDFAPLTRELVWVGVRARGVWGQFDVSPPTMPSGARKTGSHAPRFQCAMMFDSNATERPRPQKRAPNPMEKLRFGSFKSMSTLNCGATYNTSLKSM